MNLRLTRSPRVKSYAVPSPTIVRWIFWSIEWLSQAIHVFPIGLLLPLGVCICTTGLTQAAASERSIAYSRKLPLVDGKRVEGYGGTGRMLIQAPPEKVWQVARDFVSYPRIFTQMRSPRIVSKRVDATEVAFVVDLAFLTLRYTSRFVVDCQEQRMQWQMLPDEQGKLKVNAGYVKIEKAPEGATKLTYSVAGDARRTWFIPGFIKHFLAKRELLRAMRDFRRYVENQKSGVRCQ
ncbi:MAG: SRPBCC family protein [Syntrophobacteria bacterium]